MATVFRTDTQDNSTPATPETSLRIQTSVEGMPRAIVWGITRIAGNLIWYGDFSAVPVPDNQGQGGKGSGLFGSAPSSSSTTYNYYVSIELALGEGVMALSGAMWSDKSYSQISPPIDPNNPIDRVIGGLTPGSINFALFPGDQTQLPWAYLTSAHPDQALAYRLTAYIVGNLSLGTASTLPNYTFEVVGPFSSAAATWYDCDPTLVIADFLSNQNYGVPGWSAALNGDWTNARNYLFSVGLFVSYAMADQTNGAQFLDNVITSLNLISVFSEGVLKLIPRGDTAVTGNGHTYTPPAAPIYDLTDDDFLPNQNSFGGTNDDPISGQQKPARLQNNIVTVEYLDRATMYNPATRIAQDDGAILLYGQRGSNGVQGWHWFQDVRSADMAAQLALGREQIQNQYAFTIPPRFILLEPGDIVTISDASLQLTRQWVRILEIQENSDRSFNILAEEYLTGSAAAPQYGTEANAGAAPNYYVDPGPINDPIIFEPTDELGHGLQVWVAISGQDAQTFGGYDAYVSYDGATYTRVPSGRLYGSARMGVTTTDLPTILYNQTTNQIIDDVNTVTVDLSESAGTLSSGTQLDALSLNTSCWLEGEVLAYQNATLTAPNVYELSYLVRGVYGTESSIGDHPAGSRFVRIDSGVLRVPFDQTRIGATIYLKFLPFNIYGVTVSSLSDVPAHTYKITGLALASPLPNVTNVRTVFEAGFTKIWWTEIDDFRSGITYIVRKGDSFAGGQNIGTFAHPPFVAFGAGTYWIMPTCQPVAGLIVYGETAQSITIQGNMLTTNIVQTTDFQALGWLGTYTNVGKEGVDPTALLRLVGTADFLSNPDILGTADILSGGEIASSGTYAASIGLLNVGYVADCYVNVTWTSAGIPIGTDILSNNDILNDPDILNAASGAFVNVWIEVQTATASLNDMFLPTDMFDSVSVPDLFNSGIEWGAWQRYVPGVYRAQFIAYRAVFSTFDTTVIAYLTQMVAQVTIPARIDHYVGNSVGTGGLTITFEPDDASASKPFNGGPLVGGAGNHPLPTVSMDWPGNPGVNFKIDSLTLSALTFHFEDGTGTHVAVSSVDVVVEGY